MSAGDEVMGSSVLAVLLRKHIHFRMSGGNGIKEREFPKATWVFVSRKLVS